MNTAAAKKIRRAKAAERIEGVRTGKIVGFEDGGGLLVDFPDNPDGPLVARFTHAFGEQMEGRAISDGQEVLLVFENNDPKMPIIIDTLHLHPADTVSEVVLADAAPEEVTIDGRRVQFSAEEEIVLRCGKASITLTKAGKIIIRGAYLLNRSSGVNRIKGASVQIN